MPTAPAFADLLACMDSTEVRSAREEMDEELRALRFDEGLRRLWEEARAEAGVREAAAVANLEGAKVDVDVLRAATLTPPSGALGPDEADPTGPDLRDPALALAVGVWRAEWSLTSMMPALNGVPQPRAHVPVARLIASWHRDVCSALVTAGALPLDTVAVPRIPSVVGEVAALLGQPRLPALAVAAHVLAHLRSEEAFTPASGAMGALLARHVLVERGVDPTGVAVISAWDAVHPREAGEVLAAWLRGGSEGAQAWLTHVALSVAAGARSGRDVALHVRAGSLGDSGSAE